MADVFISYKSDEFDEPNWVKTTLETNGISCWMAPMSITGGSSYAVEIPQAIRTAKVFVLILSEKCQLSKWVPRELDQAINENKTILPFMLENCPLKDDFNFYLSNVQRYAAYENKVAAAEKMIREIRAIIGSKEPSKDTEKKEAPAPEKAKPAPQKKEEKTEKQKKKIKPLFIIIPALLLIAAAIAVSAVLISRKSDPEKTDGVTETSVTATETQKPRETETAAVKEYVTIAGEKFEKTETYITLEGKSLSDTDIAAFSQMPDVYSLHLVDCTLPDNALDTLFACSEGALELKNCGVTDGMLAAVNFDNVTLSELILDDNEKITDLSALKPLSGSLYDLSFDGCSVSDLSFMKDMTKIMLLHAKNNKITSLSSLSACTKLTLLDVSGNALTDLNGLESCIALEKIYASGNAIENVSGLTNATILTDVDLQGNKISDISLLSKSKNTLNKVYLSDNEISDLTALTDAVTLTELLISDNKIGSLDPLSASTELTVLQASHNGINDISALSGMTELYDVDLSYNSIEKTDALGGIKTEYRVTLDLSCNKITQLVLPKVKFKTLSVQGNSIADLSPLCETSGDTLSFEYIEGADYEALGKAGYFHYNVCGCPLDRQIDVRNKLGEYHTEFIIIDE